MLELRQRGGRDFLLTLAGRVLMTSAAARSEEALATLAVESVGARPAPRVLVAGLGLGLTLRAALDVLPTTAQVVVAELEPIVVEWCRGPARGLSADALSDARVRLEIGDVHDTLERAARGPRFDAMALDLFEGPRGSGDPHLGGAVLGRMRRALAPDGVVTIWSEGPEPGFERDLRRAGFGFECHRVGRGGRRHAIYRIRPVR